MRLSRSFRAGSILAPAFAAMALLAGCSSFSNPPVQVGMRPQQVFYGEREYYVAERLPVGRAVQWAALGASDSDTDPGDHDEGDPLEAMNRYFFEVNYALDELFLKPAAAVYRITLPDPVRDSVRNFLRNLRTPVILANDLLQGDLDRAGDTAGRFAVNTTAGVLGLFDVADSMGMEFHDEDFGQTLAVHGVPNGPYLVLPILGPTSPRDIAGTVVDIFLDPFTYLAMSDTKYTDADDIQTFQFVRAGLSILDTRSRNIETLEEVRRGSLDYYATIRSLYRQRREAAIRNVDNAADAEPGIIIEDEEAAGFGMGGTPDSGLVTRSGKSN